MQKEFIDSLRLYINCYIQVDDAYNEVAFRSFEKHQHIENIITFLEKVSSDLNNNLFQQIIQVILDGLNSIADLEEKQISNHEKWNRIKRFEKDRKNITPYIKSLGESLELYETVNEPEMCKRIKIALILLESFVKDDDLTIENMALVYYHSKMMIHDRTFNQVAKKFIHIPIDLEKTLDENSLVKKDLMTYMPDIAPFIETSGDLVYFASLAYFFEGYRLTPQMILRSLSIKLFNFPLTIPYGYEDEDGNEIDKLYKINKSALKRSIESLLMPFSQSEKFTIDIKKMQKYYVKTYFKASPILALEGKKSKNQFRSFFNPDQYYTASHYDQNHSKMNVKSHKTMFI